MNKEEMVFTEGFVSDIKKLLQLCMDKGTDSIELIQHYGNTELKIDIEFSVYTKVEE